MKVKKPKVLIVSGYHPDETFATSVGEYLSQNNSQNGIKVVQYDGKPEKGKSNYNLRRFIEAFGPLIVPIVLHEDEQDFTAAVVYIAKSKDERRMVLKPLREFVSRYWDGFSLPYEVYYGRFLCYNARYSLIDIELNPKYLSLKEAAELTKDFAEYVISLTKKRKMKQIIASMTET